MDFLSEVVIVFALTVAVLFICHKLRVPTVVGFLISGMMAGPYGFGLVELSEDVDMISELGVVLLLFTIGIEFSLKELVRIRKYVLAGGSLQVFLTIIVVALLSAWAGLPWSNAFFFGFLICLSSTAIVLKILQQRDEIGSPHGRMSLSILIYQDIVVVPLMLLVPIMAGTQESSLSSALLILLLKGAGIIVFTILSAQYIMPKVLFQIARIRSQEIFLISIILICFAVAWLTSSLGLSLSLGAFLAGLIISESEYSHQALSTVMPFKDIFTSFFFISIGMLLDVTFLIEHPLPIILITLAVFVIKSLLSGLATFFMRFPIRTIILVAIAMSQVGEFAFVLSKVGKDAGLIPAFSPASSSGIFSLYNYQMFLAVSILTMAASPFLIPLSYKLSANIMRKKLPAFLRYGNLKNEEPALQEVEKLDDHIIIIGYGVSGQNVAKAAKASNIPYVILEMNPETVRRERLKKEPIYFGDAIQESNLKHLRIHKARVLVVAIPDPIACRAITALGRRLNHKIYIIARSHYMKEMRPLFKLGANEVITEEFETSIEIFTIVLTKYLIPRQEIEKYIASIRADGYKMFRSAAKYSLTASDLQSHLSEFEITTFSVDASSWLCGKSIIDLQLRQAHQVNLLAVIRENQMLPSPGPETILNAGDRIILSGHPESIFAFSGAIYKRKGKE